MVVVHHHPGRVPDPVAEDPQAPAEVHVLEKGKIVLVEPPRLQEEVAPYKHGAATGKEDVPILQR